VKWPNDIYAGEEKIGGILVESRIEGQKAIVNVGIGVNVANPHPTVCLNSLMPAVGQPNSSAVDKKGKSPGSSAAFRVETVIAKTLTKLEELLDNVEKEPIERLLDLYQQNWIHSSEDEVSVEMTEGVFSTCQILGVDEYGFLRAVQVDTGNVFSVRPDGNSFDITNKLIAIKQ
jgi:biotin--protein ligase